MTAYDTHSQFQKGAITAKEIVEKTYANITESDKEVKAFLHLTEERATAQAAALDSKKIGGRLAGVPIAIKDNMHMKGEKTTCGSKFLENYRALFDSTACRLLEQEGAILVGKTNLDEFAMGSSTENSAFQVTRNPRNLDYVPGGSSGGSAAAVAAGMTPLSLGSDTGGSIRQPAAFCGVVGFKPTYGRVSRYGLVAFGSSLDCVGPFANTVKDIAMVMEVLGSSCQHDSTSLDAPGEPFLQMLEKSSIKGSRIGVPWSFLEGLEPEVRANFDLSIEKLKELGAEIVDVDLNILKYSIALYYILATAEASTNLARFDGVRYGNRADCETLDQLYEYSKQQGFGPEVKSRILLGTYVLSSGYQDAYYKQGQRVRTLIIQRCREIFESCHMIAMPTCPSPAFKFGAMHDPLQMYLQDIYTVSANLAGLPAISIPSGTTKEGLPLSLQFIGPQRHDGEVLRFARAFEEVCS